MSRCKLMDRDGEDNRSNTSQCADGENNLTDKENNGSCVDNMDSIASKSVAERVKELNARSQHTLSQCHDESNVRNNRKTKRNETSEKPRENKQHKFNGKRNDEVSGEEKEGQASKVSCVDNMGKPSGNKESGSTGSKNVAEMVKQRNAQSQHAVSQVESIVRDNSKTKRSDTSGKLSANEQYIDYKRNVEVRGKKEEDQGSNIIKGPEENERGRKQKEQRGRNGQRGDEKMSKGNGRCEIGLSHQESSTSADEKSKGKMSNVTTVEDVKREINAEHGGMKDEKGMKGSEPVKEANTDSEAEGLDAKTSTAEHSGQNTEENLDKTQVTKKANSTQGKDSHEDHGSEVAEDENPEMMSPGENEGGEEDERGERNDEPSASTSVDGDHSDDFVHPATVKDENHKQSGKGGGTKDKVHAVKQVNVELPNGKEKLQTGEDTSPLVERVRDIESSGSLPDREQAKLEDSSEDGSSAESVDKNAEGDGTKVAKGIDDMTENDEVRNKTNAKPSDKEDITNKKGTEERAFCSIRVTIMTSLQESTVSGLVKELQELKNEKISSVSVLELPYSGLENYRFEEPVEFMILCHSIHNRRFGLTDVPDSLYDDFLPYCEKEIGKDNIVVISHDFDDNDITREIRMKNFRYKQPTTFKTAGLVLLSGKLGGPCQVAEKDWIRLIDFIYEAAKLKQEKSTQQQISTSLPEVSPSQPTSIQDEGPASNQELADLARREDDEPTDDKTTSASPSDAPSGDLLHSRSNEEAASARQGTDPGPKVIHVCTSSSEESVSGLIARLSSTKSNHEKVEARFLKLPHVRLDEFEFESSAVHRHHGMVLCHSHNNGGLTVTDVCNALYNKYLPYCSNFFGKERVAVIVHDMKYPIKAGEILMSTFRRNQPIACELSQLIVFSGSLVDDKNLEMSDKDWKDMQQFLEKI